MALYIEPIMAALQVSRSAVSIWYTLATLGGAAALVPFGHLADRLSARRYLLVVIGVIAAGLGILAASKNPWQVLTGFALLRLAGQGAIGVGLLAAVVRRFPARSGSPLSVANLGYPAGEIVFPFLVTAAIALGGWRLSLALLALAYVTVAMPLLAQGLAAPPRLDVLGCVAARSNSGGVTTTAAAFRSPVFWGALVAFSVLPVAVTALFFHQVAIFRLAGIDQRLVPLMFAVYAISHALTTGLLGPLIDSISPRAGAAWSAVGLASAVAALLLQLPALTTVVAYAALLGASAALAGLAGALVWPFLFGTAAIGRIRGLSSGLRNCATAAGPLLIMISEGTNMLAALTPVLAVSVVGLLAGACLPRAAGAHRPSSGGRG